MVAFDPMPDLDPAAGPDVVPAADAGLAHDPVFELHQGGKMEIASTVALNGPVELSMAYTPGVARVCEATNLTAEDVIRLHTETTYTVYAIGFVPGFPYMGYLPEALCGVGRLPSPRTRAASATAR